MPEIKPYYQQTRPALQFQQPQPRYRAVDSGLGLLAEGIATAEEAYNKRAEEQGRAWATSALSDARLKWTVEMKRRQEESDPNAPDFTANFVRDFDEFAQQTIDSAPSAAAKKFLHERLSEVRVSFGEQAATFEAAARVDYRDNQFKAAIDNAQKLMAIDPDQFDVVLAEQLAIVDSSAMPPKARADMRDKVINGIASASVTSRIQKNPAGFLASIGWNDPARVKEIINPDGSISTERTITIEKDGKHYVIPTIIDGKEYSEEAAIGMWEEGINKAVGQFGTEAEANQFAQARSAAGGKRSNVFGPTGDKAFDILPFDMRTKLVAEALSLKNSMDSAANAAIERQNKQLRNDTMKEAFSLAYPADGSPSKLTRSWIEAQRPILDDKEYESLIKMTRGGTDGQKSDPEVFRTLQDMLYKDPERARTYALQMHKSGSLSNSDLSAAMARSESLDRQGGPKTEYERSRARISDNLKPSPLIKDAVGQRRAAEAIYEFDTWVETTKPTDAEIAKRGAEIINRYQLWDAKRALPPPIDMTKPPTGKETPHEVQLRELGNRFNKARADYNAKKISKQEFYDRASAINREMKALGENPLLLENENGR